MKLEDGMEKALWNDREYIASKVTKTIILKNLYEKQVKEKN